MSTQTRGIKVDPTAARAASTLLERRARLTANGTADPELTDHERGRLAGIDEALAALWAATLEGGS